MDKWDKRFMELAETVAGWSSCYQENRHIGAVIVKDKRIMTTGYNGAPAGVSTCAERRSCLRREQNIPSGTCQEICYAVHAEQNAIIQAAKLGVSVAAVMAYFKKLFYCTLAFVSFLFALLGRSEDLYL